MPRRVNLKDLTKQASEIVLADQKASYEFLRARLGGIGVSTTAKILKRLEVKGVVRRGKGGHWVVIVQPDGSPKSESEIPPKRRFRKARRQPTPANGPSVEAPAVADTTKLDLLICLAEAAGGQKALILQEIVDDFKRFSRARNLLDALED